MATKYIDKEYGATTATAIANDTTGQRKVQNLPDAAGLVYDKVDDQFKFNGNGTVKALADTSSIQTLQNKIVPFNTYAVDGAITLVPQTAYLTKGSAGAYTVAAPGAAGVGTVITLTTGTDFAHVVTFTGTTLQDGTAGANSTWTSAAVQGSSLTIVGVTATKWNVVSFNLGTIAP